MKWIRLRIYTKTQYSNEIYIETPSVLPLCDKYEVQIVTLSCSCFLFFIHTIYIQIPSKRIIKEQQKKTSLGSDSFI